MKSIVLSIMLLFAYGAASATIKIVKANGGKSGYKYIVESHDRGNSSLSCVDPGNDACKFTVAPSNNIHYAALKAYAEDEIQNGNLSGSGQIGNGTVTWNATDEYNCTIEIN